MHSVYFTFMPWSAQPVLFVTHLRIIQPMGSSFDLEHVKCQAVTTDFRWDAAG